jgi:hypothetical protein
VAPNYDIFQRLLSKNPEKNYFCSTTHEGGIFVYSGLEGMVNFLDTEYTDDYKIQISFLEFNSVREKEIYCKD